MKYCFGVDIGGTTVKLGLFSEAGAIVEKWEIVTRTERMKVRRFFRMLQKQSMVS